MIQRCTKSIMLIGLALLAFNVSVLSQTDENNYTHWDLTPDIDRPWEILWGPDGWIWYTERGGYIYRVHPETGEIRLVLDHHEEVVQTHESGMLGLVLHPDFENEPFVFVSYSYMTEDGISWLTVGKWRYNLETGLLEDEERIIPRSSIGNIHAGSRLLIGDDNTLYITIGDRADSGKPQNIDELQGKVIRVDLDGNIPDDNPFAGRYVWSLGHRNPQGLCWGPSGQLYSTEHGASTDDELNIITKGGNFGWPRVEGYCDTPFEEPFCEANNVVEPIAAWTPTIAPSGTLYYPGGMFPEWANSVFIGTLKNQSIYRMLMSEDGNTVVEEERMFANRWGRLRDFAFSPEGRVFVSTTNAERDIDLPDRILEILRIVEGENVLSASIDDDELEAEIWGSDNSTVTVTNNADEPVRIYNMRFEGDPLAVFYVDETFKSVVIPANSQVQVKIGFGPVSEFDHEATFVFDANDRVGTYSIEISGEAEDVRAGNLSMLADFGNVNAQVRRTFTFEIEGTVPQITSSRLTDQLGFRLHSARIVTVGDASTLELDVSFIPVDERPRTATVTLFGEGPDMPMHIGLLVNQPQIVWVLDNWNVHNVATLQANGQCFPTDFSVQMFNISDETIEIGSAPEYITAAPSRLEVLNAEGLNSLLAAGEMQRVNLRYAHSQVGIQAETISWPVLSGGARFADLTVAKNVTAMRVETGDMVEFEPTRLGSSDQLVYSYVNTIMEMAQVTDVRIIGPDADQFRLINWLGESVPEDASMCAALAFEPTSLEQKSATLEISIADLLVPISVPLVGNGVTSVNTPAHALGWQMAVQPNPIQADFAVEFELDTPRDWTLTLIDLSGRETTLGAGFSGGEQVRLANPNLTAGVYILRLQAGETTLDYSVVIR